MTGLIRPPNFENQYNFWRCLNDMKMIFWYLYWFQIFRFSEISVECSVHICSLSLARDALLDENYLTSRDAAREAISGYHKSK